MGQHKKGGKKKEKKKPLTVLQLLLPSWLELVGGCPHMPSVQKIVRFSSRATPLILGAVEYLIIIERIYIYIYI